MTLARSKDQWLTIFATQTDGSPTSIAARIIGDLWGYGTHTRYNKWRKQDDESLANALEAYAERKIDEMSLSDLDTALAKFP